MQYSVGVLAKRFGLSRSALLYYDSIGLLKPAARGPGEYRRYSEEDAQRLSRILLYRRAGLSLADIGAALGQEDSGLCERLEERLEELNQDIAALRSQQRLIVGLLKRRGDMRKAESRVGYMNRRIWTELLEQAGFGPLDQLRWHMAFERHNPEKHASFLEFLCIPEDEAARIRAIAPADLAALAKSLGLDPGAARGPSPESEAP